MNGSQFIPCVVSTHSDLELRIVLRVVGILLVGAWLTSHGPWWVQGPIYAGILLCLIYLRYRHDGRISPQSKAKEQLPSTVRQILWGCFSPPVVGLLAGLWVVRLTYLNAQSDAEHQHSRTRFLLEQMPEDLVLYGKVGLIIGIVVEIFICIGQERSPFRLR